MEEYKHCEECGVSITELHHIVFKSHAKYMQNIPINFKYLCPEHHRGNKGPHLNRKTDLKYKLEMQKRLFSRFQDKQYYKLSEIAEVLSISESEAKKIVKTLIQKKEGYDKVEIIIRCMGGILYAD